MAKEDLEKFLDSLVDKDTESAQASFHNYLEDKMKDKIHGRQGDDIEVSEPEGDTKPAE